MYFCQHLPFHNITDSELRAAVKGDTKLDFDKYCDMKLVLNEESGDECVVVSLELTKEC